MYKISLIIFREFLEIVILLGIIFAVTKNIKRGRYFVIMGIVAGVIASLALAFFAGEISSYLAEFDSEIFDISIITLSIILIISTILWMQGYSLKVKKSFANISNDVGSGASKWILSFVTFTAVLREGAEIVLYVSSICFANSINILDNIFAVIMGAALGILVGSAIYFGLIGIAGRYIFKISSLLLSFIAAGLASDVAGILNFSGIYTLGSDTLWDSTRLLADSSIFGEFLHVLIGYNAQPTTLQVSFYFLILILIFILKKIAGSKPRK